MPAWAGGTVQGPRCTLGLVVLVQAEGRGAVLGEKGSRLGEGGLPCRKWSLGIGVANTLDSGYYGLNQGRAGQGFGHEDPDMCSRLCLAETQRSGTWVRLPADLSPPVVEFDSCACLHILHCTQILYHLSHQGSPSNQNFGVWSRMFYCKAVIGNNKSDPILGQLFHYNLCSLWFLLWVKNVAYSLKYTGEPIIKSLPFKS